MTKPHHFLAIDLGAESGRTIAGCLQDGELDLAETHRFINAPVLRSDGLHWDMQHLWTEIKTGLAVSSARFPLESLAVDAWGVDFGLLDRRGTLLAEPFHYRDARTDGMLDEAYRRMAPEQIYAHTGSQFLQINTLYQLLSMIVNRSPVLDSAQSLLNIPDLFNYWLSGCKNSELTITTTTQCYDPRQQGWAWPVLEALGIPSGLFQPVISPGTLLGPLLPVVAEQSGVPEIPVIAVACHDTASAVAAVPAQTQHFAWISSGTWSIMGVESRCPSVTPLALEYHFTNEGGVFGTWRLSHNMMGLWLVQECKRAWQQQGDDLTYDNLTRLAGVAQPFLALIDTDDSVFLPPGDMPGRIQAFCRQTGQNVPQSKGEIVRVVLESIALNYRWTLERLEELTGTRREPIHIFGGGSKNRLLNQLTADATGRQVVAGPVEATATGNILMQAITLGYLGSLQEARQVVQNSFALEIYKACSDHDWNQAFAHWLELFTEGGQRIQAGQG